MSIARFGRIRHAGEPEEAVRATLVKWLHTFLNEVERQHDIDAGTLARPREYTRTTEPRQLNSANLPVVAIEGTGPLGNPMVDSKQVIAAEYGVSVTVYAKGRDRDDALDNARIIGAAIRAALTSEQGCTLEGAATDVRWIDEDFAVLEATRERTMAGTEEVFGVLLDDVMTYGRGPDQPDPDPDPHAEYPDPYTAESVEIDLDQRTPKEEL